MMNSTGSDKPKSALRLWSVVAWVLIWHGLSVHIGQEVLLASPASVAVRLSQLLRDSSYWKSIFFSLQRIAAGFLLSTISGIVLASLAARLRLIEELLAPIVLLFTATPVASITILVLIWISSRNLSVLISFMMVLPIIYANVLNGINSTDRKLLEMAEVFEVSAMRRIVYIYVPQVLPFFRAACLVGLGLCWKAGVAAEVIGIPKGSIGEKLYMAKIYLATPDLFAWTLTIIAVSVTFEQLFMLLMRLLEGKIERL